MQKLRIILKQGPQLTPVLLAVAFLIYAESDEFPFRKIHDRIHPINYVKIQIGMTLADVETILGEERIYGPLHGYVGPTTWWGWRYIIHVELDDQGLVKRKTIEMHKWATPTTSDRYYKFIYGL